MPDEVYPVRKGAEEADVQVVAAGLGLEGARRGNCAVPAIGCIGFMVRVCLGHCACVSKAGFE